MKKLFLFLLLALWGPTCLLAQTSNLVTPTQDPTRAALDNVFANVDKNQVLNGYLAEYALPLVPLDIFNGTLTDSSRTTPDGFRFIYGTIYSANTRPTNRLPTLQDVNARIAAAEAAAGPTTIPIMVQRVIYEAVRSDAFSANLLTIQNGQVFDVAGRTSSPYQFRMLFAAAPARAYAATGNVSLVLPDNIYLSAGYYDYYPQEKYLDFGDGRGYLPVSWDQPLAANYQTAGIKRVKVRFVYGGIGYESHFDLEVAAPAVSTTANATTATDYSIPFAPVAGVRAGGKAYVHLAPGHTVLTKPLIVAEGYDKSRIAPLIQKVNYSIEQFLGEIQTSGTFDFRNALENVGSYDIVFIDYDDGTADILDNAGLFEAVLNRVNADKQGTEQNVVMGISMGGLIARYKLADMVKAGRPTQTRLLILQDSPQRGANVPLGLQALTRQAASVGFGQFTATDLSQTLAQAIRLLDRPATRQLLLYQATDGDGGFRANTFVEGEYRTKVTFPTGQQPPYQIIAASQGSQCGIQLFNPSTELLHADGKFFISPLFFIVRTSYKFNMTVNALPYNGNAGQVSRLHAYTKVRLFLGLMTIQNDYLSKTYICPSGLLPLDGAPGGTVPIANTPGNLAGGFKPVALPFLTLSGNYSAVDVFNFIPTPSALDIADFNPTSIYGKYSNSIASTSYSRVNDFLAQERFTRGSGPSFNQAHTIFTARNSEWMFNKMDNRPLAASYCTTECFPLTISNPLTSGQRLCEGASATFSIPNLPAGTVVKWSATPTNLFTTTSGSGPTFTTTATGTSGTGTITATVGSCNTPVSVSVLTGPGEVTGSYYSGAYVSGPGTPLQTTNPAYPDKVTIVLSSPYTFTFTSSSVPVTTLDRNTASFYMPSNAGVQITARATNSPCGVNGYFTFTPRPYSYTLIAAPNPASTDLTVTAVAEGTPANALVAIDAPSFEAELYDNHGQKVKAKKSDKGKAVLDVRDLPAGLYNLRAGKGKEAISEHIQVTH